jgi:Tfp pilus assembly protein PilF
MIRLFRILLLCLAVAVTAGPATAGPAAENQPHDQQAAGSDHNGTIGTALALVRQGKPDEAEQLLLQALALTPDPAQVYYQLGRIYDQRGDNLKAIAAFKEGIKIHEQGRRTSR